MISKGIFPNSLKVFLITIFLLLSPQILLSEDNKQPYDCLDQVVKRIEKIRSLPEKKYLHTLDGQKVLLNEFYSKCLFSFPKCSLYRKFYFMSILIFRCQIKE